MGDAIQGDQNLTRIQLKFQGHHAESNYLAYDGPLFWPEQGAHPGVISSGPVWAPYSYIVCAMTQRLALRIGGGLRIGRPPVPVGSKAASESFFK